MTASAQFRQILDSFPPSVQKHLETIPQSAGALQGEHYRAVLDFLNITAEELMLRLLPLAGLYSRTPISGFQVGAVAKAAMSDHAADIALFLGANIEFQGQILTQTIHAEQCAVVNAWQQGASQIEAIAVTASPCGHCRQFLYELDGGQDLKVIIHGQAGEKTTAHNLSDLLPQAFGPRQIGHSAGLMARHEKLASLGLRLSSKDPFVQQALSAANKSYAPYSHNHAGSAIKTGTGAVFAGRYVENAAFNPSLSPLHAAIIGMNMDHIEKDNEIVKAVLVEKPTSVSQRAVCELLLQSVATGVRLEYYEAV